MAEDERDEQRVADAGAQPEDERIDPEANRAADDAERTTDDTPPGQVVADEYGTRTRTDDGWQYEDGYRITDDGRHFAPDGIEIPDEEEPPAESPAAAERPEPVKPKPGAAKHVVPAAQQRQIVTRQNMFSEEESAQLDALETTDPMRAREIHYDRLRQLDAHANRCFDEELEAVRSESPELVELVAPQLASLRRDLSVEQLQAPHIVRDGIALLIGREIAQNPGKIAEYAEKLGKKAEATAKPKEPAKRRALPVEERMPRPSGARREIRRDAKPGGGDALFKTYRQMYPAYSDAEIQELVDGVRAREAALPRNGR